MLIFFFTDDFHPRQNPSSHLHCSGSSLAVTSPLETPFSLQDLPWGPCFMQSRFQCWPFYRHLAPSASGSHTLARQISTATVRGSSLAVLQFFPLETPAIQSTRLYFPTRDALGPTSIDTVRHLFYTVAFSMLIFCTDIFLSPSASGLHPLAQQISILQL